MRVAREFLDHLESTFAAFDITDLERIGSGAYFTAVGEVRAGQSG